MEFNRQSIALLQQIKRLAKQEQGAEIHYDSSSLESDLRILVKSGVSADLLALIEAFLPTREPEPVLQETPHLYRGSEQIISEAPRSRRQAKRVYRGQIVD